MHCCSCEVGFDPYIHAQKRGAGLSGRAHLLQPEPVLLEQALPVIRGQRRRLAAVQLVVDDVRVGLITVCALVICEWCVKEVRLARSE